MPDLNCLRCKSQIPYEAEACSQCGEKVTQFQRTYSTRLIDGKYQILDRLGIGGMGEIFKVRHIHLQELRVIKIMRPNIATDEQALQRFLHEAKLSTMVKHRNLAMLYDFSTLDDGSYYMVWEFIDGVNLQKWVQQNGPFPSRLAIEIAIQALSGLEALHQMGIIHRDISPENIMLSQDHMGRLVTKVIDFGIAKQLDDGQSGQGLTQTGMFLGKLKYASPEQAGFIKEGEHLDARSDLYTFGVVLYEMLAGRAPFLATNPHGYILKHATEKPPTFAALVPDIQVPEKLEAIVMKSLEKDRANRHAHAAEFIQELEGIRNEVVPDKKFGLGERMITLSAAKTEADMPRPTMTGRGGTQVTSSSAPTAIERKGTLSSDATVVERMGGTMSGSDSATIIERPGATMSGAAPTVMENLGGAAPTVIEPKVSQWQRGEAAPTVIERKMAPPKKKTGLYAGIAAAAILVVATVAFMLLKKSDVAPPTPSTTAVATSAPSTDTSGTTGTTIPVVATKDGKGTVLLTAFPYIELSEVRNLSANKTLSLKDLIQDGDMTDPMRLDLEPGEYIIKYSRDGKQEEHKVVVQAGVPTPLHIPGKFNIDDVVEDILSQ